MTDEDSRGEGGLAAAADPVTAAGSQSASGPAVVPGRARGRQTVADMVRSLALVLLVVGVVALITIRSSADRGIDVDITEDLAAARLAAPYDVLAPVGLDDHRPTSVRYRDEDGVTIWHIGFVAPSGAYIGLDQVDGPAADFVDDLTEGARSDGGVVTIDGVAWERYDGGGSSADELVRGLVRADETVTVLVSGTAGWDELEEFADALQDG